jgi:hypothetical protein
MPNSSAHTAIYISTAVRTQGELYGGSIFHPSAATDTLQGRAIQNINELWGEDAHRGWSDYKNIGIPVCKKKYRPFEFQIKQKNKFGEVVISVVRMYGCSCHSNIRKKLILQHGERNGWEPFGQWSLSKAKAAAKKETQRLNAELNRLSDTSISVYDSTSEEENTPLCIVGDAKQQQPWQTLCSNGTCNWKIRGKFDDICSEIEREHFKRIKV